MTQKQREAARENIKKAQKAWQDMTSHQRSLAQPEGSDRASVGTKGEGEYYRIIVRPKSQFTSFRYHDVGSDGHTLRLAGHRSSGSWATHAWLIHKDDSYVDDQGYLRSDRKPVQRVLRNLRSVPRRVRGDIFESKPRRNVPEKDKPTAAQQRARKQNIEKAQQARHH